MSTRLPASPVRARTRSSTRRHPDAHRVDERVGAVAGSEDDFTADGWQAEAVAVPADTAHYTLE